MFDIEKFKNSNVQTSVKDFRKIYIMNLKNLLADKNDMSFNNVVISCVKICTLKIYKEVVILYYFFIHKWVKFYNILFKSILYVCRKIYI